MSRRCRRGEIWWADLPDDKERPCIVLTNDRMLPTVDRVTVVPITTTIRGLDVEADVSSDESGLRLPSVANCGNLQTVSRRCLTELVGPLTQDTLNGVVEALHHALDLEW